MAKYGLFDGSNTVPIQEFEGDEMVQQGDHVYIHRNRPGQPGRRDQVGAIRLAEGQCVKEIK